MTDIRPIPTDPREVHALYVRVADAVRAGHLAVIPTDTSYAVIADAFNPAAVAALRAARGQDDDVALPVAVGSMETAHGVAHLSGLALDLAAAVWSGPLTILTTAQQSLTWNLGPADTALAIRVPGHAAALGILERIGPVVMTSAAPVGQPPLVTAAAAELGDTVAIVVDAGLLPGSQSSVVDATSGNLRLVREGALTLAALRDIVPMLIRATS